MKTIINLSLVALLVTGTTLAASARESHHTERQRSYKYEVTAQLVEKKGTFEQRKSDRMSLEKYMMNCPYISHFKVEQKVGSANNHDVVWTYEASGWNDISKFNKWVDNQLKHSKNNGLKEALAPFAPNYNIGGQIRLEKINRHDIAKG